jgi:hypothetical protein
MKLSRFQELLCAICVVFLVWMFISLVSWHPREQGYRRDQLQISYFGYSLKTYESTYGSYPDGGPAVILKKLSGDNPQNIKFLNVPSNSVSSAGEFLDPWGTPYSITLTNGVFIVSAGKDKKFGSKDDLVFDSLKR